MSVQDFRISSLDGLRGLAAAAVVFSHLDLFYQTENPWLQLNVGDEAVALFFSLSGFLMAILYGERRFDAADFLVHRFARIYPVYLVAVLWVATISVIPGIDFIDPIEGPVQVLRHLMMIGSTGVFWSIPPEIQFYLFFPAIWLWFGNPKKYQWLALLVAAFLVVDALLGLPGPGILLVSKLPYFLFGAIAGRIFTRFDFRPSGLLTGVLTLGLLAFFLLFRGIVPTTQPFWGLTSAFAATLIVYLAACQSPVSAAVLGAAPLTFIGRISFSLYLFHVPVIFFAMRELGPVLPPLAAMSLAVIAAFVFAWLSNLVIEEPSRRILTGFWRRYRQATPAGSLVHTPA